jgi:succinyl-diaminopimelate desuccinylase
MFDAIAYTQKLVQFDTTNPPGREAECVEYVAHTLQAFGFQITRHKLDDARMNAVAVLPGTDATRDPLVLTGHLDTVPLGAAPWTFAPFGGEILEGKLYGRGASDMKSGVAAIVAAAGQLAEQTNGAPRRGLTVVLTCGEETGCAGALHLVENGRDSLGAASGLIVAEPTANRVAIAHKGALFIAAEADGVTAHSSQPELGVNAIYKAARAITKVEDYGFNEQPHPLLGSPTINVGMVTGGMNVNSVPDSARFTIDIRTTAVRDHESVFEELKAYLGADVALNTFTNMPAVSTEIDEPLVQLALGACREVLGDDRAQQPYGLPFFTDASALGRHYQCPTLILGPGEPPAMHQTDEYCLVKRIREAVSIYTTIVHRWCAA